jgi:hypothetical protein
MSSAVEPSAEMCIEIFWRGTFRSSPLLKLLRVFEHRKLSHQEVGVDAALAPHPTMTQLDRLKITSRRSSLA